MNFFLMGFALLSASSAFAVVVNPVLYYDFESSVPGNYTTAQPNICTAPPSIATTHCMGFAVYGSRYEIQTGGPTGKYFVYGAGSTLGVGNNTTTSLSAANSNSITYEVLLKPSHDFIGAQLISSAFSADDIMVKIEYPNLVITTTSHGTSGNIVDVHTIGLVGSGIANYSYLFDGNWHHLVVRFQGSSTAGAVKSVCIDGQCPAAWRKTIAQSQYTIGLKFPTLGNTSGALSVVPPVSLDQLTIYDQAISDSLVRQHYLNFQAGQPFNFNDTGIAVPAPGAIANTTYDLQEFAPNSTVPITLAPRIDNTAGNMAVLPASVPDALIQLRSFPAPRYRVGHTMPFNFNWMNTQYMTGILQPGAGTIYQLGPKVALLERELGNIFHYGTTINTASNGALYTHANSNWTYYKIEAANDPALVGVPANFQTFGVNTFQNQALAPACYLQNAAGGFLNILGSPSTTKIIRPTSSGTNGYCPDSSWDAGATNIKNYILSELEVLNKNVNIINENGEVLGLSDTPIISGTAAQVDPVVQSEFNASGATDFKVYQSAWAKRIMQRFGATIIAGGAQNPKLATAKFTEYARDGMPKFGFKWSEMRNAYSLINGNRYSTTYFYIQNPNRWSTLSVGSDHGLNWTLLAKHYELPFGDKFHSPFVSPGWSVSEELNTRPGQWMGLLTMQAAAGAEWFYTGFFNSVPTGGGTYNLQEPRNWIWQAAIPAYVQAAVSREESLYRNSNLMVSGLRMGNEVDLILVPGYRFATTDLSKVVMVRKHSTLNKYLIFSTIQRNTNYEMAYKEAPVEINLDNQVLKFKTRMQGAIYVYDRTVTPATFKQLDAFHEYRHPARWSKDFRLQGELPDNWNDSAHKVKTSGVVDSADFTNSTSAIGFQSLATAPIYKFTPRMDYENPTQIARSYYTFIKARSLSTSTDLAIHLDGTLLDTVKISGKNFSWCRMEGPNKTPQVDVKFSMVDNLKFPQHELKLVPRATSIEIDEILLTTNANENPAPYSGNCVRLNP